MKESNQREPIEIPNNASNPHMFDSAHSANPFSLSESFRRSRKFIFDASQNLQRNIASEFMTSSSHGDPFFRNRLFEEKSPPFAQEEDLFKSPERNSQGISDTSGLNGFFHSDLRQSIEKQFSSMNSPFKQPHLFSPSQESSNLYQSMSDPKIKEEIAEESPKKETKAAIEEEERVSQSYSSGLPNLGNTCYMNSVLQCLMNTYLYNYILDGKHLMGKSEEKPITESFAEVLCSSFSEGILKEHLRNSVSCLKKNIEKVNPTFKGDQQNDAHEFFRALIEKMHSEMNNAPKRLEPATEFKPSRRATTLHLKAKEWKEYSRERDNSIITKLFGGVLLSEVFCTTCRYTSYTFEDALDLSLNLPMSNANSSSNEDYAASLLTCLDEFVNEEEIEGYQCENCQTKDTATKRTTIWKAPEVLAIQLKRFVYNQYGELDTKKNRISFPLDNLNIEYFMHEDSRENRNTYQLTGVIDHYGDLNSGHYVSYVYNEELGCWLEYNDHKICKIQDETMKRHAAGSEESYILFYKRK